MQQFDGNHNDFANSSEADKALMVRFFYKDRPDKAKSLAEGRPMFKEVTYIEIRVAGQRDVQACRPATAVDKQRFPLHLDAFEKRVEAPTEGMPLSEWPQITRTEAEELTFLHVKTVEQLASMKDSNLQNFRGGYGLRDKAVKWLETTSQEAEQRDKEELVATIDELKAQVAMLMANQKQPETTPVPEPRVNALLPDPEPEPELTSELDAADPEPVEGAAVPVPPAPAGRKKRARKKK